MEELWYPEVPFLAAIKKSYDFEGSSRQVRGIYAGIRGSNTFATALAAKSTPSIVDFTVTRSKQYVLGSIDNEALMASRSNKGAIARAVDTQIKAATYEFGRALAHQTWGNSGGSRGRAGTISTTRVTLSDVNDAVKFEVGMEVVASSADGTSGAVRAGSATITAIDRVNGYLDTDSNWTAQITGFTTNDYLFREGDFGNSLAGVLGWIPITAPTAGDSWYGVDRSVDVSRLAGQRVSGSGAPEEETVYDASAEAAINGAKPDLLVMNPKRFAEMQKNLHSKAIIQVPVKTDRPNVSFSGLQFPGPRGPIVAMSDHMCPYSYGVLTEKASWELACLGRAPHFSEEDGLKFSREASDDAIEFRLKMYGQLLNHRPVGTVLITW